MHRESREYIEKISSIRYKNHVVITHYPPLKLKDKENFMTHSTTHTLHTTYMVQDFLSSDFMFKEYYENEELTLESPPLLWIFGHTHRNMDEVKNNTRYLSNQSKDNHYKNNFIAMIL